MDRHAASKDVGVVEDNDCQNPLYPEDADLTVEEMEAMARARTMARAQAPGELVCILDQTSTEEEMPFTHDYTHGYAELMAYRRANDIPDTDPWTYWLTADAWADIAPPPPYPPLPGNPIVGWNHRAVVNPSGPPVMDGAVSGLTGYTIATMVDAAHVNAALQTFSGVATLVRLYGAFSTIEAYIAPLVGPWIAQQQFRLSFGGNTSGGTSPDGNLYSDALSFGIDGSRGFIVSIYITAGGIVGQRVVEPGWQCVKAGGNLASMPDKTPYDVNHVTSPWTLMSGNSSLGVLEIDGYYGPPAS